MEITTILTEIMDRIDRVETKVEHIEERLSLLEESCSTIRVVVERVDAMTIDLAKDGKVSVYLSLCH